MDHGDHWDAPLINCDETLIDKVLTVVPGLFESVYELATMVELQEMQVPARRQVDIPVRYRDHDLGTGFRADIIVKDFQVNRVELQ